MKPSPAARVSHDPSLPIALPRATRPLTPAHIALLELVAAKIVDDLLAERAERDNLPGEKAS